MLRLPESKTTQNILQTKVEALRSNKNINDRHNGHVRAIKRKTKRQQKHSGNLRPLNETRKGLPVEGTNS